MGKWQGYIFGFQIKGVVSPDSVLYVSLEEDRREAIALLYCRDTLRKYKR